MVYGAGGAGARVMTSSSSPGISLKMEGVSYCAGAEIPCVIVNISRAGPGLGGIQPAQGDYFQAVKGGGHGDYRCLVYAPSTVQEFADYTVKAFDKADEYRTPVMLIGDGLLGQMMEPAEIPPMRDLNKLPKKAWAADGNQTGGKQRVIESIKIAPEALEDHNHKLFAKYEAMKKDIEVETYMTDDAEVVLVAYGSVARIAKSAVNELRAQNIKAGLIRPITLFPYPSDVVAKVAAQKAVKKLVAVELSMGQMVEDVKLAVNGVKPVEFFGRAGGIVMVPSEIVDYVKGGKK
jgi:2-oxoglutarate ferredoxin oxidoreductase subunit alpha